jgi:hypothetical protein
VSESIYAREGSGYFRMSWFKSAVLRVYLHGAVAQACQVHAFTSIECRLRTPEEDDCTACIYRTVETAD